MEKNSFNPKRHRNKKELYKCKNGKKLIAPKSVRPKFCTKDTIVMIKAYPRIYKVVDVRETDLPFPKGKGHNGYVSDALNKVPPYYRKKKGFKKLQQSSSIWKIKKNNYQWVSDNFGLAEIYYRDL